MCNFGSAPVEIDLEAEAELVLATESQTEVWGSPARLRLAPLSGALIK
jgi:hypothetical protein